MTKSEKRWQLLLVADDGRIIPFKRIKGLLVTVAVLLVVLGLICAGLGWQVTAEKVRHNRTHDQLADANRQLGHYKSQYELITAELVLAEIRMEKAGLPVTKRHERVPQQPIVKTALPESTTDAAVDGNGAKTPPEAAQAPTTAKPETSPSPTTPVAAIKAEATSGVPSSKMAAKEERPAIVLGDLEMQHDTQKKILLARFRIKNNDPRSSPVAGQCVVVLKGERLATESWQSMPKVTLKNGVPDGRHGRGFKISRFINMEILTPVQKDPSSFKIATIYVFDTAGTKILEKGFPIDLPAPKPEPDSGAEPAVSTTDSGPETPVVALNDLKMTHDAGEQILWARFRLTNTGPRSSPVAGRCVVVLKDAGVDAVTWLAMPTVTLVDGRPDGDRGQAYRIARFKDMEVKTRGIADPSAFKSATVYVFDSAGAKVLEKDFAIDLPAPRTEPETQPAAAPVSPGTQEVPLELPPPDTPDNQSVPAVGVQDAGEKQQPVQPPDTGSTPTATPVPADAPADDPSLTEGAQPTMQEDARSRF